MVMYAGIVVEEGNAKEVVNNPLHPYTKLLKEAAPDPEKFRPLILSMQVNLRV